ncbi:hypothetical protein IPM19_02590 [bacterium]|nr:MAG: hypothetical protein IPM19_02590 [bacterium]
MIHQTTKQYLLPLLAGSVVAITGFIFTIIYTDPYQAGVLGHIIFYLTLFLFTCGIFSIINLLIRKRFFPGIYSELFRVSLRQGIIIGILITSLVFLEAINLLFWWVGLTLALFLIALESFLTSN